MHNDDDMKHGGEQPATRRDLAGLEARLLERFGEGNARLVGLDKRMDGFDARMDGFDARMDGFGVRMDGFGVRMERFDARMDGFDVRMDGFGKRMEGFDARMDNMETIMKRMAVGMVNLQGEVRAMKDDFASAMTRMESRLLERMDGFMSKAIKVDRGQTILVHRVDKLEQRVGRLEKRPA